MSDAIFTPVYRNDTYLYHECSECEYQVKIKPSVLAPLYFGETFKFCPNCGKSVVRFANLPKFKEEFNMAVFNEIQKLDDELKDKLDYYCRVVLSQEEFETLHQKCRFVIELHENGGPSNLTPSIRTVAKMSLSPWNHWNIRKLKEKIERGQKDVSSQKN